MEETICSVSSASGTGAIAVIRISGKDTFSVVQKIFKPKSGNFTIKDQNAYTIHFGNIVDGNDLVDEVLINIFKAPRSYTGEDSVEITCHGSTYIQQKILELLVTKGARLAKPGEFTLRAFLNGKLDLSQAEGVADLISSSGRGSHKLAMDQMRGGFSKEIKRLRDQLLHFISMIELELDFSEEDLEFANRKELQELLQKIDTRVKDLIRSFEFGNAIKKGIPVVIVGRTNAGKSTLLNYLLREEKAIVSEIEGTTRDYIEDTIIIEGIEFRFIDTAGLRVTKDKIENLGISRTMQKADQAKIIISIIDTTLPVAEQKITQGIIEKGLKENKQILILLNKTDLTGEQKTSEIIDEIKGLTGKKIPVLPVSLLRQTNLNSIEEQLKKIAAGYRIDEKSVVVSNVRHYEALQRSHEAITRAMENLKKDLPSDLLAMDIREVMHYLGEITGEITTDEILGNIFKNFCIGK
jgi:tRNA modification GTPase